jgi:hypothetical protein
MLDKIVERCNVVVNDAVERIRDGDVPVVAVSLDEYTLRPPWTRHYPHTLCCFLALKRRR